jgi:exosortase
MMSNDPTKAILKGLAVAGLVGALFFPTLRWLVISWLKDPYYSHGFLIPLIAGFFVWRRRAVFQRFAPYSGGMIVLALGLTVHLTTVPRRLYPVSALTLVIVLAGLVLYFYGLEAIRRLIFPLAFLLAMIPVPFIDRYSPFLAAFSARHATLAANTLGIPATHLGSQVQLAQTSFTIGEPCSGLRSIVALLTLTIVFVYVMQGSLAARSVLLIAALPIAIVSNIVRLILLLIVADLLGQEAGWHYFHNVSSPVLFLIAFALLILTARSLRCFEVRSDI